jgi:hypothetical protein
LNRKRSDNGTTKACREQKTNAINADDGINIARSMVLLSWVKIIQGLIQKAIHGGHLHTKLLLDICGIPIRTDRADNQKEKDNLCDVLLKGLEIYERSSPREEKRPGGTTK